MRRKLYKPRRGQISIEIMYAVGVIIMIFLLLTGISFNRRGELRKMDDYLQKRNECLKVANTIASLTSSGFNTAAILSLHYPMSIFTNGRITVEPSQTSSKETPCTYVGYMNPIFADAQGQISLSGSYNYCFMNVKGQVVQYGDEDTHTICTNPPDCNEVVSFFDLCTFSDRNFLFNGCG